MHARIGSLTVVRLGEIRADEEGFHSETAIYPVGYLATRLFFAPGETPVRGAAAMPRALYRCEILAEPLPPPAPAHQPGASDGAAGRLRPVFKVTVKGTAHVGKTATEACECPPAPPSAAPKSRRAATAPDPCTARVRRAGLHQNARADLGPKAPAENAPFR